MPAQGSRLALRFAEWPQRDQQAWRAARDGAALFGDGGLAAGWKPKTALVAAKRYGLWLGHLHHLGRLDPLAAPGARLSEANLRSYVAALQARVAPPTVVSCLRQLAQVIRALDPTADRTLLQRALRWAARRAGRKRDPRVRRITPALLFRAGLGRMQRAERQVYEKPDVGALCYLDGLVMALLACRPIRLGPLVGIDVGVHLTRAGDRYHLAFTEDETKGGRAQEETLPAALTPYLERYLQVHRPTLLRGRTNDALWISAYRRRMSEQTLRQRFRRATGEELPVGIPPHAARAIAGTGTATERPDLVGLVPLILDHADARTAHEHYVLAERIHASRVYGAAMLAQIAEALSAGGEEA